jgi:hypothetical protein
MKMIRWAMAGLALVACDAPQTDGLSLSQARTPIFGGSAPDAPEHDAVVGLHQRSGDQVGLEPFCSGTLIAPDIVLTAAHCLDVARRNRRTFTTMSPASLAIYFGNHAASDPNPLVVGVQTTLIHPAYDRFSSANDIALVRLVAPIQGLAPVPALPANLGLVGSDIGTPLDFAGFGLTETGSSSVKLHAEAPLGGFGCTVAGCPDPGVAATMISYAQPDAGPCSGDSGGPAFIQRNGAPYVAGVTSYGDRGCIIYGVSTRADAFDGFIADFVGDGPVDPEPAPGEPEPTPGEPEPTPGGCGDGVCGAGESCDGRGATSACGDCAGRTNGKPSRRFCEVEGVCEGPGCP